MSEQSAGAPDEPIRVLTAKVGLDGHDRGVKIISRALRDAGMEVIYSGLHRTPEEIVATAIQEDVDVIGLSILSGAHMTLLPRVLQLLREREVLDRFIVVAGGVIPDDDVEVLKKMGVSDILGQDAAPDHVAVRVRELVSDRGPRA
jgi:methylmalonyl-CoA mutase cobalamin-binding domain/chain